MNNTLVLIPCYKPDEKLLQLIDDLHQAGISHIMVVDDGSGAEFDHIFAEAAAKGCFAVGYDTNRGKGYALKYGMARMGDMNVEFHRIVTADCDGQHKPHDICRVIDTSRQYPQDLILGGRRFTGNVPFKSRLGNGFSRVAFYLMSGAKVYDTQTGLRAIPSSALEVLSQSEGDRYEYEMNVLSDCSEYNIHIREIPIETVYLDGNKASHFRPLRDSYLIYKNPLKYIGVSLSSFIIDMGLFAILSRIPALDVALPERIAAMLSTHVLLPTVLARVASSVYNYTMNKKVVFHHKGKVATTFGEYVLLAVIVMLLSALAVAFIDNYVSMGTVFVKALVDLVLFVLNYIVQKRIIFRKGAK